MTNLSLSIAGAATASTTGFLRAAAKVARVLALAGVMILLLVMRTEGSILVNIVLTAAAVFALYVVFGKAAGMRLLVVYLIGFGLFDQLRAFGDETGVPASIHYVIGFEHGMFGAVPSVWLQRHFYTPGRIGPLELTSSAVYVSYFVVVHAVALLIWLRDRRHFPFYATAVLATFYVGLLISFVLPTAPPWLAARQGALPAVHRVFQEVVNHGGPGAYQQGSTIAGINDVAAMPSLHMAITVIVALEGARRGRLLGILGAAYAAGMAFSLVYLGEHYVTDEIAGVLIAAASWLLAARYWPGMATAPRMMEEPATVAAPALSQTPAA